MYVELNCVELALKEIYDGWQLGNECENNGYSAMFRMGFPDEYIDSDRPLLMYVGQEDLNGDEPEGWDEALVPIDAKKVYQKGVYEGKNHIIDDELNEYLKEIRTKVGKNGFVYVVVDACHAGSSYRGDEKERITRGTNRGFTASDKPFVPKIDKRGKIEIEKSNVMSDICILEACRSYQVNSEIQENGIYYGSLSYYVNKVLQNIQLNNDIIWTNKVSRLMNEDIRLIRQNIGIETSL